MKTNRLWYWVGIAAILIIFWGIIGHLVFPRHRYSTRKPINYDKPKLDTVDWIEGHSEIKKLEVAE